MPLAGAALCQETAAPATVGAAAPEIQVTDWIGGDGRTTLADFRGEVVYLAFWATTCPVSRGQVAHLSRLQTDLGRKGLNVVAITSEDRRTVLRYMAHDDAGFAHAVALGGASDYPCPGLPYAAVVGPDGTLRYLGPPGGFSDRDLEALVRKVEKPTAGEREARAARMLASAERLVESRDLVRAEELLANVVARHPSTESAKTAAARAKEIQAGEFAAEHAAQTELAKLLGGSLEKPAEADTRRMRKLAKVLERKAEEWAERAPRAAALAAEWREIAAVSWAEAQRAKSR